MKSLSALSLVCVMVGGMWGQSTVFSFRQISCDGHECHLHKDLLYVVTVCEASGCESQYSTAAKRPSIFMVVMSSKKSYAVLNDFTPALTVENPSLPIPKELR